VRPKPFILLAVAALFVAWWLSRKDLPPPESTPALPAPAERSVSKPATASEKLLEGYADPATPPVEDLKKIHRVITGYFSVVKDPGRFPIGGNADLAAALRGENANREVFVDGGHPVFSKDGLLIDRWGTPLVVHPEAWQQLELRSAGPDKVPFTADDLLLAPNGTRSGP
jgi:hypothetical protein